MINIDDNVNIEESLQEVEEIENGKINVESYHNINEFIKDMLN